MGFYLWHKNENGQMETFCLNGRLTPDLEQVKKELNCEDFWGHYTLDIPERPEELFQTVILVVYGGQFELEFDVWLLVPYWQNNGDEMMRVLIAAAEDREFEDQANGSRGAQV